MASQKQLRASPRRLRVESLEPRHLLAADPIISEFMASNGSTINDGYDQDSDWIELHNAGDEAVDLQGYHLTDSQTSLTKWTFSQSTIVEAGDFLLVFASGNDGPDPDGFAHTNFKLSAGGEYLALVAPSGQTVLSQFDASGIDYPAQFSDIAYGYAHAGTNNPASTAGYLATATPGAANSDVYADGPLVRDVTATPAVPQVGQPLVITAELTAVAAPINTNTVFMTFRRMFGNEITFGMRDDGNNGDAVANDNVFTATIPGSAVATGEMIRWYVSAADTDGESTRSPRFLDPNDSAEYYGAVVPDPTASTDVPVMYWFVEDTRLVATRTGTRTSLQFRGQFYDNIQVDLHGQSTSGRSFLKKSYDFDSNSGEKFDIADGVGRASDFNLLTNYADQTKIRHPLAYEVYRQAGIPTGLAFPVSVHQNGEFYGLYDFVEEGDEEQLRRLGLDEDNHLYKVNNRLTSAWDEVEQKAGLDESRDDLQDVIDANALGTRQGSIWDWDHLDIADTVNYLAVGHLIYNHDFGHKNMYWYRDATGTGLWSVLPWDVDLSFGHVWKASVSPSYFDNFLNIDGGLNTGWNNMFQRLINNDSTFGSMLDRRLRTLMDQFFGPPGTATDDSFVGQQIQAREALLQDEIAADTAEWIIHPNYSSAYPFTPEQAIDQQLDVWLPQRRAYLENTSAIPNGHGAASDIRIETIEFDPSSGDLNEQYVVLENRESFAVDISGWTINGAMSHTIKPGTVIPANGDLHLVADVQGFLARTSGPRGGEKRFLQSAASGSMNQTGGVLQLVNTEGTAIDNDTYGIHADLNNNGGVGCLDIDLLTAAVINGTNPNTLDLTNDGIVDHSDITEWLTQASLLNLSPGATYQTGDANLDGLVNDDDFAVWNSHRFTASSSWCDGDFNTDGFVDVSDFNLWNQSKSAIALATVASESIVTPEPSDTNIQNDPGSRTQHIPRTPRAAPTAADAITWAEPVTISTPANQNVAFEEPDSEKRDLEMNNSNPFRRITIAHHTVAPVTESKFMTQFQTNFRNDRRNERFRSSVAISELQPRVFEFVEFNPFAVALLSGIDIEFAGYSASN